jgi:cytochrome bd-type quinol oxidase subunit 2
MTADVIDLKTPAGKMYAEDHPARIAQEYVSGNPKFFLWLNLVAAIIAVLAAGLLDVCLIYNIQSERFHDAYNNFVGSAFVLFIVSLVTLAIFWLIGEGWDKEGVWRRLAVSGYILLIFLLTVLLFPSYGQTISDIWDGGSSASVFIHNNHNRAEAPPALVWFFVAVVAMAYSSGGLSSGLSPRNTWGGHAMT